MICCKVIKIQILKVAIFYRRSCVAPHHTNVRLQNSPYFCVFKYTRAVKQKVSNEAENRERDWGETLKIFLLSQGVWGSRASRASDSYGTLYLFLYLFSEKNRLFCSLYKRLYILATLRSYIGARVRRITLKLGDFVNIKALFSVVLTDFPSLVPRRFRRGHSWTLP